MTTRRLGAGASMMALALAAGAAAHAQETTASIRGEVRGAAGTPAAGAAVTVLHLPTASQTTTTANDAGAFELRGLRPGGPYRVTVVAAGTTRTYDNVTLTLGDVYRLDVNLAQAAATPEATAVQAVVITGARRDTSPGPKTVLSAQAVQSVVSINRDVRDLARRDILVAQHPTNGGISIAGSNPRMTRITVDGVQAQDRFGLNIGAFPTRRGPVSLDAIEQFTVEAVPVDVQNGDFQGGALNIVLKSGGNRLHGSAFLNYFNDGMRGRSIRGVDVPSQISQTNYGAFLSGPIVKDTLFFALSYERYRSSDLTQFGAVGAGFPNNVTNLGQGTIDRVVNAYDSLYASDFDPGAIERVEPVLDKKWSAKFDWNINADHRLTFTHRHSESTTTDRTDLSATTATLRSHWYDQTLKDDAYALELNSRWSSAFSTQFRANYRNFTQAVLPPSGQTYADVAVCTALTSVVVSGDTPITCPSGTPQVRFGPDQFRHANALHTQNTQFQLVGNYVLGDHSLKAGVQVARNDVYNLFVPASRGVYYFDSLADFEAGNASRLQYTNAITGDPGSAAANFQYFQNSLFLQDTWDVAPGLRASGGVRYDFYSMNEKPALNPNFTARNGFDNLTTYDGKGILMPRFNVDWRPLDALRISVGGGLFSGGVPDVVLSNSFSTTGVLTSGIDIQRTASGTFTENTGTPGFSQATGAAALNNLKADPNFGFALPQAVRTLQGGATASPLAEVNAFSPDLKIPGEWKAFARADWTVWRGWRLGVDGVYSKTRNGLVFTDTRAQPLIINGQQARLPDGRLRYDAVNATAAQRSAAGVGSVAAVGGNNRDIVVANADKGYGYVLAVTIDKRFDNGFELGAGYAYQKLDELGSALRFSSTASSLYSNQSAGLDPNLDAYGRGLEEIKDRYKLSVGYRHAFVKDYETGFSLFAERRSGRVFNVVMSDLTSGRGPVFGVNRSNHLLYVPDLTAPSAADPLSYGLVQFDSAATRDAFVAFVQRMGLPNNAIVDKGAKRNRDVNRIDFQFSQQLPGLFVGKPRLVVDIQNVLNLIHDKWGVVEEYPDTLRVVSVQCANAAGQAVAAGDFTCARYRYSNFNTSQTAKPVIQNDQTLWAIQVSLKYEF